MGYVHIYAPEVTAKRIVTTTCVDCGKRTRLIGFFQDWHGWRDTCLRCGRTWDDGEWTPLDFVRASRRKSIDAAQRRWRMTECDTVFRPQQHRSE